jgi:hypothetical protein
VFELSLVHAVMTSLMVGPAQQASHRSLHDRSKLRKQLAKVEHERCKSSLPYLTLIALIVPRIRWHASRSVAYFTVVSALAHGTLGLQHQNLTLATR